MTIHQRAREQHLTAEQRELIEFLIHNLPHHHQEEQQESKITKQLAVLMPKSFFDVVYLGRKLLVKLSDRMLALETSIFEDQADYDALCQDVVSGEQYKVLGARLDEIALDPRVVRLRLLKQTEVTRAEYLRVWELREYLRSSTQVSGALRIIPERVTNGWNHVIFAIDGSRQIHDTKDGRGLPLDGLEVYEPNAFVLSFQPDQADRNAECNYKPVFSKPGKCLLFDFGTVALIPLEGDELLAAHARWKFIVNHLDTNFERNHRCSLR